MKDDQLLEALVKIQSQTLHEMFQQVFKYLNLDDAIIEGAAPKKGNHEFRMEGRHS